MVDRTLLKENERKKSMDPQQYDADNSEFTNKLYENDI